MSKKEDYIASIHQKLAERQLPIKIIPQESQPSWDDICRAKRDKRDKEFLEWMNQLDLKTRMDALSEMVEGSPVQGKDSRGFSFIIKSRMGKVILGNKNGKKIIGYHDIEGVSSGDGFPGHRFETPDLHHVPIYETIYIIEPTERLLEDIFTLDINGHHNSDAVPSDFPFCIIHPKIQIWTQSVDEKTKGFYYPAELVNIKTREDPYAPRGLEIMLDKKDSLDKQVDSVNTFFAHCFESIINRNNCQQTYTSGTK